MKFSASLVKLYEIFENSYFREPPRYGAPFLKKKDFFAHKLSFLGQNHLAFVDMKYFLVLHQHVFVESKLLFVQRQTFYFNTKCHFCLGHRLECYVTVIYFYFHIATKI